MASFNSLFLNVRAGPDIPIPHPNNGWHWGIEEGEQLYYEIEVILSNTSTGEVNLMFKDIWIYNITSIENVTRDWHGVNDFSQVNATQCYYNLTDDELEAYNEPTELALFGYDNLDDIVYKYRAGHNGMAFVLPLNGSNNLEVDILDDILNQSFYYPLGQSGYNQFDHFESNPVSNRIYFSNSSHGFFTDGYYYDNGTLSHGIAYMMVNMGDGPVFINASFNRVFDYDITDEVEWDTTVGSEYYYDFFDNYDWIDDAQDVKIHITNISDILLEKSKNNFGSSGYSYMVFQAVYADIYVWNGSQYLKEASDEIVGLANNFYPQYFDTSGPIMIFLYPSNVQRESLEFLWNNDTARIWEIPFDEITYHENGYLQTKLVNSTGSDFADVKVDLTTGLIQSYLVYDSYHIIYFELKYQTLVSWSVDIGDSLYYKQNDEHLRDYRRTITGFYSLFVNMTRLAKEFDSMGLNMVLPTDQPELQFFSFVTATHELWDPSSESWISLIMGDGILAIANIYWPITPLIFDLGSPPFLVPENTQASDMEGLFTMFDPIYDIITYDQDTVILTNSTEGKTLYFHFDESSGRMIMMHGWANMPMSGSDWNYMSLYMKKVETLSTGNNQFSLESDFTIDITVDVDLDVSVGGPLPEYIYCVIPFNPVNVTLPNGTALIFFDQLITNSAMIDGNITFTIQFPTTINLAQTQLFFFGYNTSGNEDWGAPSDEFFDNIIYNYETNSITFEVEAWGSKGMISAFAYIDLSQYQGIPGFEPILIFGISIIATLSIISIFRKKIKN